MQEGVQGVDGVIVGAVIVNVENTATAEVTAEPDRGNVTMGNV